ncbi:hypothetical protein EDM68_02115 [Candidatus Uhrbacteria bacterium]|nr:MAG: hypothetical protein EDM68_02115 [Candidatus Uhrbacteria bacterium]
MTNELQAFVKEGLSKGLSREKMKTVLLGAGWQDDEVRQALDQYADIDFPIPVPKRKPYLSAREAFMYLVMFLTLYVTAFSVGTILFQIINLWLPDAAQLAFGYASDYSTSLIRSSTAAIIITFPLFLFMARLLQRAIKRDPSKRSSLIRKWLTYITLYIATGIIVGDLITLVTYVLNGDLTLRFVLKVLVVLVIAGSVFGYYLWDLRTEEKETL